MSAAVNDQIDLEWMAFNKYRQPETEETWNDSGEPYNEDDLWVQKRPDRWFTPEEKKVGRPVCVYHAMGDCHSAGRCWYAHPKIQPGNLFWFICMNPGCTTWLKFRTGRQASTRCQRCWIVNKVAAGHGRKCLRPTCGTFLAHELLQISDFCSLRCAENKSPFRRAKAPCAVCKREISAPYIACKQCGGGLAWAGWAIAIDKPRPPPRFSMRELALPQTPLASTLNG